MKTLKILLITFISLALTSASFAQPKQNRKEKVESMKIAFLTKQLDLTPEEAQVFWPIYNQYQDKQEALRKSRKQEFKEAINSIDSLSNKEVEALVDGEIVFKQRELDIQKEYHQKFKSVLPIKKVGKLYRAEEQFKRELIKRLQEGGPRRNG